MESGKKYTNIRDEFTNKRESFVIPTRVQKQTIIGKKCGIRGINVRVAKAENGKGETMPTCTNPKDTCLDFRTPRRANFERSGSKNPSAITRRLTPSNFSVFPTFPSGRRRARRRRYATSRPPFAPQNEAPPLLIWNRKQLS